MIRCNSCGTNNLDGSEYCDECGMKLDLSAQPFSPRRDAAPVYQPPSAVPSEPAPLNPSSDGPSMPQFTTSTSIPKPALPARPRQPEAAPANPQPWNEAVVSPPQHNVVERRAIESVRQDSPAPPQRAVSSPNNASNSQRAIARLVIERGGRVGKEFQITGIETNIGRWDADSGIFPDIDLDEDDPEAKISRRHARIVNHNGQFFIEDLGSTNGTFINRGRRLLPGKRHALQNGDEVIVGKTFLKFHILI